ncbi:helix-turn-helix domain-containing protein [Nitrospirillum iridis]|uniref:CRP-like cAMP-binding protein n=1 Tax=Nitrospirillum iridis TaxID=765888 RepID=A0A7X0EBZ9_9PROT|nr:helix-turn-helix domain-containing protein [Nitrospirillum iridis]MBB6251113.1 CRP-like cAMP-binding protein [Nitrospirillum iridis]
MSTDIVTSHNAAVASKAWIRPANVGAPERSDAMAREVSAQGGRPIPIIIGRGQALFQEGDPAGFFYHVLNGTLRSSRILLDGRRHISEFHMVGDFFGFGGADRHANSAEAVIDTTVAPYPRALLDGFPVGKKHLMHTLLADMTRRLAKAQRQVMLLGRKTADERVAAFLLEMAVRSGSEINVHLPMSRGDIADHLGLTTETISRTLTKLHGLGLIARRAAADIDLIDRPALVRLAEAE